MCLNLPAVLSLSFKAPLHWFRLAAWSAWWFPKALNGHLLKTKPAREQSASGSRCRGFWIRSGRDCSGIFVYIDTLFVAVPPQLSWSCLPACTIPRLQMVPLSFTSLKAVEAGPGFTQAAIDSVLPGFGAVFVAIALFFFALPNNYGVLLHRRNKYRLFSTRQKVNGQCLA